MIPYMLSNKKLNPILIGLFIKGRKLNISLVFIIQFYIYVPKSIWLNSTLYFIMKIPKKQELQQIAFMNFYKKCSAKPYSFLVIDCTLVLNNPLGFR